MAMIRVVFAQIVLCFFNFCLSAPVTEPPKAQGLISGPPCSVQTHPNCINQVKNLFQDELCAAFSQYSITYCKMNNGIHFDESNFNSLPPENINVLCNEIIELMKSKDNKSMPVVNKVSLNKTVCVDQCQKLGKLCYSFRNLGNTLLKQQPVPGIPRQNQPPQNNGGESKSTFQSTKNPVVSTGKSTPINMGESDSTKTKIEYSPTTQIESRTTAKMNTKATVFPPNTQKGPQNVGESAQTGGMKTGVGNEPKPNIPDGNLAVSNKPIYENPKNGFPFLKSEGKDVVVDSKKTENPKTVAGTDGSKVGTAVSPDSHVVANQKSNDGSSKSGIPSGNNSPTLEKAKTGGMGGINLVTAGSSEHRPIVNPKPNGFVPGEPLAANGKTISENSKNGPTLPKSDGKSVPVDSKKTEGPKTVGPYIGAAIPSNGNPIGSQKTSDGSSKSGIVSVNHLPTLDKAKTGAIGETNVGVAVSPNGNPVSGSSKSGSVTGNRSPIPQKPEIGGIGSNTGAAVSSNVIPIGNQKPNDGSSKTGIVSGNQLPFPQKAETAGIHGSAVGVAISSNGNPIGGSSKSGSVTGNYLPFPQKAETAGVGSNLGTAVSSERRPIVNSKPYDDGSRYVPAERIPSYDNKPMVGNEPFNSQGIQIGSSNDALQGTYGGARSRNNKQEKTFITSEYNETPSSAHFMGYFLTAIVLCIAGYVVFHNKQKIIAFIIEGRNQRRGRRPNSGEYKKLQTNVDDVMTSLEKTTTSKNYIY